MNDKNGNINGKKRPKYRNLLINAKFEKIEVGPNDMVYIRVPEDSSKKEVQNAINEMAQIFPNNRTFVIPDTMSLHQFTPDEWKKLGLIKITLDV